MANEQATLNAKDSIAYGTKVVGGVSPGKAGQHPFEIGKAVTGLVGRKGGKIKEGKYTRRKT